MLLAVVELLETMSLEVRLPKFVGHIYDVIFAVEWFYLRVAEPDLFVLRLVKRVLSLEL